MSKQLFFAFVIFASMEAAALATQCTECVRAASVLREQNAMKARATELLGKNQTYLASLSADQASKFLKLSSNVTQILRRLDAIKKQAETTEIEMQRMNCQKCGSPEALSGGISGTRSES